MPRTVESAPISVHDASIATRTNLGPSILAFATVLALVVVPRAAAAPAASPSDGSLSVATRTSGDDSVATVVLAASGPIARVVLTAPAGYGLVTGQPAGTEIGYVLGELANVTGSATSFVEGEIIVVDPATQVGTPESEACAPGRHDAVWRTNLSVLGQSFPMGIYVDRPASQPTSSFVMRFCPAWPASAAPPGVTARQLSFTLYDSVTRPSANGRYTWSGLVSPVGSGLTPDEARTFEVRAAELIPHELTLSKRHEPSRRRVTLSGTLTAAGQPVAGARVRFSALTESPPDVEFFGPVTTDASGRFSISRTVTRPTRYSAEVEDRSQPCQGPSSAPAGCAQETVASPAAAEAVVRVRLASDAKLVPRPRDQAAARRTNLVRADFPEDWEAIEDFSPFECRSYRPKLSMLTATGDAESSIFVSELAAAASRATVYQSEAQAKTGFRRVSGIGLARCQAETVQDGGVDVLQLGAIPFPKLGAETKAYRVVYDVEQFVVTYDFVYFRTRRTVVQLLFAAVTQPLPSAEELARKVAARAGA